MNQFLDAIVRPIAIIAILSAIAAPLFAKARHAPTLQGSREMLTNGRFTKGKSHWETEQSKGAKALVESVKEGPDGQSALRLKVLNVSDQTWRLQLNQKGLHIKKGQHYVLTFWAKAKVAGAINATCMQNHEPWGHSTQQKIELSTEWKQHTFAFVGAWDDDNTRITFTNLGTTVDQVYWFANCSLLPGHDIDLDLSNPSLWTVDTGHLGTKQVTLAYDASEKAAVITPTWSARDLQSEDAAVRNVANSGLYAFQTPKRIDCTQVESYLEISMPRAYIDEGKLGVVFCLQGGKEDDYLFSGRNFTMKDFAKDGDTYKKFIIKASDFPEGTDKLRGVLRIGLTLHRNGSMVSAPIKVRQIALDLNSDKIVPPLSAAEIKNPKSFYEFTYTTASDVARIKARVDKETMDITRQLDATGSALALIPQWKDGQIPTGAPGDVYVIESLGVPHNFELFEVQWVVNIPKVYFDEGKIELYLCIQAGKAGYGVWSGSPRQLKSFADKAGQDVVLTLTPKDFEGGKGKKRDRIEILGLKINRHGSTLTEPITLKRITVNLPQ